MVFIILISLLVPTALLAALAFSRPPNFLLYLLSVVGYGLVLFLAWLVLPWHITSMYLRMLLPFAFAIAALAAWARIGTRLAGPPDRVYQALFAVFFLAVIGVFGWADWKVLSASRAPSEPVRMAMPLQDGFYVVGQGGASRVINGHHGISPQDYAIDIIGMNALGSRLDWFSGRAGPAAYAIFGHRIYAPCDGEVRVAEDGHPDLFPGQADRHNLAGNHVLLGCQDTKVLLAHMMNGSLEVSEGDIVATGDLLGRVGNSGNTSEPHLHLQVARGGGPYDALDGRSVPMLLDGRFLVRGDLVKPDVDTAGR